MPELHAALAAHVDEWRGAGYAHDRFDAVGEILQFAVDGERAGEPFPQSGTLRFLRAPQLRALETYWYLRIVEGTPHIADLYGRLFDRTADRLAALGLDTDALRDITLADIPERKSDLVAGSDDIDVPPDATDVAVRITDMLGEEILVVLPVATDA